MENLREAHRKGRKGKNKYSEVRMVDSDIDYYLKPIQEQLINKTFTTSEYVVQNRVEGGKERVIHKLPYYPDRIVQWAIMLQIEDVFIRTFIQDTYAAIPSRGMHLALNRLQKDMKNREETKYCLKADIKKYFPSINTEILKQLMRRKFKDYELLWLLDDIIDSTNKQGVPIGNYTSQYFGNFYLAYFDHWIKENKKCKHYFRYMDDIVVLGSDKKELHDLRCDIESYLKENLNLTLKENWQVFPTYVRGVDFVGYRSFGDYTLLRKSTSKKLKRKMRDLSKREFQETDINSIMSYKGWLEHCNSYNLQQKYIEPLLRRWKNESTE